MSCAIIVESRTAFIAELTAAIGDAERIVVVASERARRAGAIPQQPLAGRAIRWFTGFGANPDLASACAASALISEFRPAVIVGLGGGSAMDVAKAARVLPPAVAVALNSVRSGFPAQPARGQDGHPKMVAVPTLSGSGAEVTRFATLYHNGRKISVDDIGVQPDIAIIDPSLAATAPHPPTSAAVLDAICHAVESAWCGTATDVSREHSGKALRHLAAVQWKTDGTYTMADRYTMAAGAVNAGRAINLTKTTAAHACAYLLTVRHGIPHGIACALNMQWVTPINAAAAVMAPEAVAVIEPSLGVAMTGLPEYFRDRLSTAGWPTRLAGYGVSRGNLPAIAADATDQARMRNNPVRLTVEDVERGLTSIL